MRIHGWVDNDIHPPTFGMTVRTFHLYQALARHARVSVTCAVPRKSRGAAEVEVDGVRIRRIKPLHPAFFYYLERLRLAPLTRAHGVFRRFPGALLRTEDKPADVWQIDSLLLCGLFAHARPDCLKVYSSQNVEAEWFDRVGPALWRREAARRYLESIERDAVEEADLVLAITERDRTAFRERYGVSEEKLVVVENGIDLVGLRPPTPEHRARSKAELGLGEDRVFLFTGSDFAHNRDAVENLFREVVPQLAPLGARLLLVGDVATPFRARAEREGGGRVHCVPNVEDMRRYLWASDVGLNPVTTGAGSNLKVPTYLGARIPVVTTPFGLRGYERLASYVVQAPMERFAEALEPELTLAPGADATLAAQSWDAVAGRLLERYRRALGEGGGGGSTGAGAGQRESACAS